MTTDIYSYKRNFSISLSCPSVSSRNWSLSFVFWHHKRLLWKLSWCAKFSIRTALLGILALSAVTYSGRENKNVSAAKIRVCTHAVHTWALSICGTVGRGVEPSKWYAPLLTDKWDKEEIQKLMFEFLFLWIYIPIYMSSSMSLFTVTDNFEVYGMGI